MRHIKFYFLYISSPGDRIFKILVSTPYNTALIIRDRHKNFEDLIAWTRDIRKTKFDVSHFFGTLCNARLKDFRNPKLSKLERFRAPKFSRLEGFRALKLTGQIGAI
jgi:hypothetical protein